MSSFMKKKKTVGQKYMRQIDYHRFKLFKLANMFIFSENTTEEHALSQTLLKLSIGEAC